MKTETKQKLILLKNKKGVINIGGMVSGAGSLLRSFFEILPKPIKFLLYLLLLLLIGAFLQASLQVFGIYCDSANNPVHLGLNVFSNIGLMDEVPPPELIGKEVIDTANLQRGVAECTICFEAGEVTIIHEEFTELTTTRTCFYKDAGCVTCAETIDLDPTGFTLTGNLKNYCLGDAFRKEQEDKSLLSKWLCGAEYFGRCEPPEHYYYDSAVDLYVCADETCAGITAGQIWDEKLINKGATYLYPEGTTTGTSYTKFIGVTCQDIKPVVGIYGIPIFDYKLWIFLMLIFLLFFIFKHVKQDK